MISNQRLTARAQVTLALTLVVGLLVVIILLMLRPMDLPPQNLTVVTTVLSSFVAMAISSVSYFFARHRPNSDSTDPLDQTPPASPAKPPRSDT